MAKEESCIQAKNNAFHQALKNTKGDTVGAKSTIMLAGIKDVKETFKKNIKKYQPKNCKNNQM